MTRDAAMKHKEVIQAFLDGEDVEYWNKYDRKWHCLSTPQFQSDTEYRVKPKEEIIPMDFSDAERLIGKTVKHKDSEEYGIITSITASVVQTGSYYYSYKDLMDQYEFLDGSPIGKLSK